MSTTEFILRVIASAIGFAIVEFMLFWWRAKRKERNNNYDR